MTSKAASAALILFIVLVGPGPWAQAATPPGAKALKRLTAPPPGEALQKTPSTPPPGEALNGLEIENAPGVTPLTMDSATTLPWLEVPAEEVSAAAAGTGKRWMGFYIEGRKYGFESSLYRLGKLDGQKVLIRRNTIAFPARNQKYFWKSVFAATGKGELLRLELTITTGDRSREMRLIRKGEKWRLTTTRAGGKTRTRTLDRVEESLSGNEMAFFTLLKQGKLKPGARFRYRWFSPKQGANRISGLQLLAIAEKVIGGKPYKVYKIEMVLPHSRQHWTHILDANTSKLVSYYGKRLLRFESEAEARRSPGGGWHSPAGGSGLMNWIMARKEYFIAGLVLLIIFFPFLRNYWRRKRDSSK